MSTIFDALEALKMHCKTLEPKECCVKQPMYESSGKVTMCCIESCPWLKLEKLFVDAYIEADHF